MLSTNFIKDIAPSVYKLEKRFRLVERNFGLPSFDPRENDDYTTLGSDGIYNMAGYFPQAKRNYLLGLSIDF